MVHHRSSYKSFVFTLRDDKIRKKVPNCRKVKVSTAQSQGSRLLLVIIIPSQYTILTVRFWISYNTITTTSTEIDNAKPNLDLKISQNFSPKNPSEIHRPPRLKVLQKSTQNLSTILRFSCKILCKWSIISANLRLAKLPLQTYENANKWRSSERRGVSECFAKKQLWY